MLFSFYSQVHQRLLVFPAGFRALLQIEGAIEMEILLLSCVPAEPVWIARRGQNRERSARPHGLFRLVEVWLVALILSGCILTMGLS
jgi:hypothetical protein